MRGFMDWIQVLTIIGTLGGLMIYLVQRMDRDITTLSDRVDKLGVRLDGHASRIDKLYTMFIDLLKERK
jgi:hypothetical protein